MCKLLVVKRRGEKIAVDTPFYDWSYSALALLSKNTPHKRPLPYSLSINAQLTLSRGKVNMLTASPLLIIQLQLRGIFGQ